MISIIFNNICDESDGRENITLEKYLKTVTAKQP